MTPLDRTRRIVTETQLRAGVWIRWPSGVEKHGYYTDVKRLPNGTFDVREPEMGTSGLVYPLGKELEAPCQS